MIDGLLHYDERTTVCTYTVSPDNIFCEDGRFGASGLIENMAQTCAARIGFVNKYILHKAIGPGLIGGIRNLRIFRLPAVGEHLETMIEIQTELMGFSLVQASVRVSDRIVAEAVMKIALE